MSKHWDPRRDVAGRTFGVRRAGLPAGWNRYRARGRFSRAELRITVLGGLLLGLVIAQFGSGWGGEAVPELADVAVPDHYAESRRSKAILEGQEGAPPSAFAERVRSGATLVGADARIDVIDGDTFDYGGDRIRIADIDTPEVNGRCAYETRLAAEATGRMAALLAAGPFELQPVERDTDKYGRKLRIVMRGGHSLGAQLVEEGLAREYTGRRMGWCA